MEVLPTCRFFEAKAGECTFSVQFARVLAPYVEAQRRLFRRGANNGDIILALEDAPRRLPDQAEYPSQFAALEGYARCRASTEIGSGEYAPDVVKQRGCNRYISTGTITVEEVLSSSKVLSPSQLRRLPPGGPNP